MKPRLLFVPALLCLAMMIAGVRSGSAQQVQPLEPEWLMRMYEEGWQKLQEGVLRRDTGGGRYETFSYGMEGLQWVVEGYERQLEYFQGKYNESPNTKLAGLIEQLQSRIDSLYGELAAAPSSESFDGEALEGCSMGYGDPTASAGPRQNPRGVWATATANFDMTGCSFEAHTFATAYAHTTEGTVETTETQNDPKSSLVTNGYPSIRSTASASADGSTDCEAWAHSELRVPQLSISLQSPPTQWYGCPAPVTASITGPTVATTDYYTSSCTDVTWSATATGGAPGYTYEWYIGTSLESSGSTLTKRYCETDAPVTVKVVARDVKGWTDEETFQTELQHTGPVTASVGGLSQVNTNNSTPCLDVTWTARATEGHPGYTYEWYTDTSTTVEGTGSTFIKRYCSTTQAVTVRVVARDSDGHTDDATKLTNITHTGPPIAAIGGPALVNTDSYTSSCADVTWTASATEGTPGYAYEWYIGASLAGSGVTLTKRYCDTDAVLAVKVVARDAAGATDDATHQTTIQHTGLVTASVSGPSQVNTNTSTTCADVTWTASATEGHPGYTYQWYIGTGTAVQGSGASFTKRYCSTTQSVTVKVVATDSDGHTDDATKQTSITHTGPPVAAISGSATVTTDYYTSACADVTWTASATGGYPGYTYQWFLGTSTTIQGTGTTFTKRYCDTNGTVTVKVVAKDTRSTTDDATFTTTLQHKAPIVGAISGPATVATNTATPCADVTWTASATSSGGNHSGFTYSWYIGTALQGSGSTLTKRYCSTSQSVTVKLVTKASDAHTSEVTKTTTITHDPTVSSPTPTISGPIDAITMGCKTLTWTASATGGTSPYTFNWYIGTTSVGSGTSYSKSFCNASSTVNLKVIVRDSAGRTGEDLHTTNIEYIPSCGGSTVCQ